MELNGINVISEDERGSAPTMAASRAAFGVRGNALPAGVSYLLLVGWETVLGVIVALAIAFAGYALAAAPRVRAQSGEPAEAVAVSG
ncbi:MAG: cytosine permease [Micromonosporaceae bacterium]